MVQAKRSVSGTNGVRESNAKKIIKKTVLCSESRGKGQTGAWYLFYVEGHICKSVVYRHP